MHERSLSVSSPRLILNGHGLCGKGGHVTSISLVISRLHRNLRNEFPKFTQPVRVLTAGQKPKRAKTPHLADPPIKRFAQRHTYLGTDAIAARDLGFAMAGRQPAGNASSIAAVSTLEKRTESLQSMMHVPQSQPSKRQPSPDLKRREDSVKPDFGPPSKRQRALSPPRERDRDRFDGPPPRRRFASPAGWEKERDRELGHIKRDRDEDKPSPLPAVLSWFVGQLPNPATFDGTCRSFCVTMGNYCCIDRPIFSLLFFT